MKITVEYAAQVKRAAGVGSEVVEVDDGYSVQQLVQHVAQQHGDTLSTLLFDADRNFHPSLLLFVGDNQIRWDTEAPLNDGDVVTILSPISGG